MRIVLGDGAAIPTFMSGSTASPVCNSSVQFTLFYSSQRKSWWKAAAWKDESWALLETDCNWWTGSEGEAAVSSRQLELWYFQA